VSAVGATRIPNSTSDSEQSPEDVAAEQNWFLVSSLDPLDDARGSNVGDEAFEVPDQETDGEVDAASFTATVSYLPEHLKGVGDVAAQFATEIGLQPALVDDLRLAGRLHDLGKADPRFQLWLCGGDPVELVRHDQLLAKSINTSPSERSVRRQARERSGYPRGQRHELQSVALIRSAPQVLSSANDAELVTYLVASHHGYCRPLAPVAIDEAPVLVTTDHAGLHLEASSDHGLARFGSGIETMFGTLGARYGWYGLARLEAIFRLADQWRSSQEQRGLTDAQ
ncbi:MAG: CRISPR-associated endonuclease Cas3'', partial [Microthrixaceae bacterium]